ncbi:hypothetical protein CBQ28_12850 [Pseudoalteromonas sp. GCY]|uniref:hypothetical protein n=1 Tax=Pseudoalteromonas sp. GCY TaxID=2003316 RepID=UPI000BFEE891|nr:hypothetical protein [Pseudoalteromonas sp. GCY]PHI36849.1 hypothetical protein CBQ28_12850 [Pseudoalteromonas sp. GCY]QQQ66834.1 hypothetical protein JJQ94_21705 [Pseudoalteromonas sp. GCY]
MNKSLVFLFIMFLVATGFIHTLIILEQTTYLPMLALVFILAIFSKEQLNITHLSTVLIAIIILEFSLVSFVENLFANAPPYKQNMFIVGIHFICDLLTYLTIKNRVRFSLRFVNKFQKARKEYIYMTHADIILVGIFFLFMLVDLAAFAENIIRNLEHFGVDEDFAKQFWKWGIVHYSYPYLKSVLLAAVITTLLATIYVERFRPAPIKESEEDSTLKKSEPQHWS